LQRTQQKSVLLLCLTTLRGPLELVTIEERRGGVSSLMLIIACCRLTWLAAYGQPPSYLSAIPTLNIFCCL